MKTRRVSRFEFWDSSHHLCHGDRRTMNPNGSANYQTGHITTPVHNPPLCWSPVVLFWVGIELQIASNCRGNNMSLLGDRPPLSSWVVGITRFTGQSSISLVKMLLGSIRLPHSTGFPVQNFWIHQWSHMMYPSWVWVNRWNWHIH